MLILIYAGGVDFPPVPLPPLYGCQYNSCLPRSLAVGHNGTNPRLNYVNSFPVSSVRVGLDSIAPKLWNGSFADLVVSGVNVGYNLGLQVYGSGTNNVAMYAARNGVPAIAFSGHHRERVAWNKPTPWHSLIYADIAQKLVMTLAKSGKPYLPERVWLNVNLPKTSAKCNAVEKFKFVLTKIDLSSQIDKPNLDVFDTPDVDRCGNEGYLPHETLVESAHGENECVVTISVGATGRFGTTTVNAGKAEQKVVMEKLKSILTCLKN